MTYQPTPVMRLAINAARRQVGNLSLHQPSVKAVLDAFQNGKCPEGRDKIMACVILRKEADLWEIGLFVSVRRNGFKAHKLVRPADPAKAAELRRVLKRIEA